MVCGDNVKLYAEISAYLKTALHSYKVMVVLKDAFNKITLYCRRILTAHVI